MKVADALQNVTRLFLDTAPVIYYVERNPRYAAVAAVGCRVEEQRGGAGSDSYRVWGFRPACFRRLWPRELSVPRDATKVSRGPDVASA